MRLHTWRRVVRSIITTLIVAVTSITSARDTNIVVPAGLANTEGNGASNIGFVPFAQRLIMLYSASQFGLPAGKRAWITGVAFRHDGPWGFPQAFTGTFPGISISLSVTPRSPAAWSLILAENLGPDVRNVFNGPLFINATNTGGSPNPFDIRIPFTTPFEYNPSGGHLALMLETVGGPQSLFLDFEGNGDTNRAYVFGPPTRTNGVTGDLGGLVTQFSFELENAPPIANAGPNQVVECNGGTNLISLDGRGSSDPDGDPITYEWILGPQVIGTNAVTSVTLAQGSYDFLLVVRDDSGLSSTSVVTVSVLDRTPPSIHCSSNLTLEFISEVGAGAAYTISAADTCDATPQLTGVPPSGVTFPIGETTVHATARDASGNSNVCSFTITVLGTRGTKYNRLVDLVTLLSRITTHPDRYRLDRAITHLVRALEPRRWVDEIHLVPSRARQVFLHDMVAVRRLCGISGNHDDAARATIDHAIEQIIRADRLLASVAIQEATDQPDRRIARAQLYLARGDQAAEAGRCGRAIDYYRRAWKSVQ
jgi:hypothetical protein